MKSRHLLGAALVASAALGSGCAPADVADPLVEPVRTDVLAAYPVAPAAERPEPPGVRPPIKRPEPVVPAPEPGPKPPEAPRVEPGPGIERPVENRPPNVGGVTAANSAPGAEADIGIRRLIALWEGRDDLSGIEEQMLRQLKVLAAALKPGEVPRLEADVSTLRKDRLHFLLLQAWNQASGRDALGLEATLEEAVKLAAEYAPLRIAHPAFAAKVTSYGVYEPVREAVFTPRAKLLVYWELENFERRLTPEGDYRTLLERRLHLLDGAGRLVAEVNYPPYDYRSRRYTHDFYWPTEFVLPREATAGEYVLKIIASDRLRGRTAEARLEFEVK